MSVNRAHAGRADATRFRPRTLTLADGESLVLDGSGTIERRSATGTTIERWTREDPAWGAVSIRFGVRTSELTVAPRGRDVPGRRPPV
jgi:hypothetical protein